MVSQPERRIEATRLMTEMASNEEKTNENSSYNFIVPFIFGNATEAIW